MPDYLALVRLFIEPLVEDPDVLFVDLEATCDRSRVWLRVTLGEQDKGRVFGRGGRTLQAIRQVLSAAAQMAGQSLYLEVSEPRRSRRP